MWLRLKSRLLKEDIETIKRYLQKRGQPLSTIDQKVILLGLNDLLQDKHLYKEFSKKKNLDQVDWPEDTQKLIRQSEKGDVLDHHSLASLNCEILKKVYKNVINEKAQPLRRYVREQPYEQLASFLLALGDETEAKEILIAKNDAKRKHGNLPRLSKFMMKRYKYMTAYGYKPLNAAKKSSYFILFGWLVFMAGYEQGFIVPSKEYAYMNKPYRIEDGSGKPTVTGELPSTYPEFDPFIYSLETFVPFLDLHQKGYWLPLSKNDNRQDAIKRREVLGQRSTVSVQPGHIPKD